MFDIEFIGGPCDGQRGLLGSELPAEEVAWVVCEDVFRPPTGNDGCKRGTITSVAIYELEVVDGLFQYRFLGTVSFKEFAESIHSTYAQTNEESQ